MNTRLFSKWIFFVIFISISFPAISQAQFPEASGRLGTLSGRVLFAGDNHPAGEARVELRGVTRGFFTTAFTGGDGSFAFAGLPLDTYSVIIIAPGCATLRETVALTGGSVPVELHLSRNSLHAAGGSDGSVSVRELSIPGKARKAFEKGQKLHAAKELAASLSQFDRAIAAFPGYYEAYYEMGLAHFDAVHLVEAEEAFRKSIESSRETYAPPHFTLGLLLCYKRDFAAAESVLRRGLEIDPFSAKGEYGLGQALFGLGRAEEAEKSARQAAARSERFAEPHALLARIHMRRNDLPALAQDLETYLRLAPDGEYSVHARSLLEQAQRALAGTNAAVALAHPQN